MDVIAIADAVRSRAQSAVAVTEAALARIAAPWWRSTRGWRAARRRASMRGSRAARIRARSPVCPSASRTMRPAPASARARVSLLLRDAAPDAADSEHVARLRRAGAVPIGKVATAEFRSGWRHAHDRPRHDAQSVEPRAHAGRKQRRLGGGGRRGLRAALHRQRCFGFHPLPGGLHRPCRPQAQPRPHPAHARFPRPPPSSAR